MARFKVRPSKPVAVMGAVFGVALLVWAFTQFQGRDSGGGFIWLWAAAIVCIVGFNLWAAFAKNGSLETLTSSDDEEPRSRRLGTTMTKD